MSKTMEEENKLSPRIFRRMEDRKAWNAYWQVVLLHFNDKDLNDETISKLGL